MKVVVEHKKHYGRDLFYATDEWTKAFFSLFKAAAPQKSVSLNQLQQLKELGFEIQIIKEEIKV